LKAIGVTGKSCSGKNYYSVILGSLLGAIVIDCDVECKNILEDKKDKVVGLLGTSVLKDNCINFKAVGDIIFKDPKKLSAICDMQYSLLEKKILHVIEKADCPVIINGALLHKLSFFKELDMLCVIESSIWKRIFRGLKRDGFFVKLVKRFFNQRNYNKEYNKFPNVILRIKN
jgi:dephospho-CoA kinase